MSFSKKDIIPGNVGLVNMSNSCYMNSSIQAISHIPAIRNYLIEKRDEIIVTILQNGPKIIDKESEVMKQNSYVAHKIFNNDYHPDFLFVSEKEIIVNSMMSYQLSKLLKGIWSMKTDQKVNPVCFKKVFSESRNKFFYGDDQHDAEEAYSCIIQKIQEELHVAPELNFQMNFRTTNTNVPIYLSVKNNLTKQIESSNDPVKKQELINLLKAKKMLMPIEKTIIKSFMEIKKYHSSSNSIITDFFTGFLHSGLECPSCHYTNHKFEAYQHLSLPIPLVGLTQTSLADGFPLDETVPKKEITIMMCADIFCAEETLDEKNLWKCKKCKQMVTAKKKMMLWTSPKILVIQLKRFDYVTMTKNDELVNFPLQNFDVSSMISPIYKNNMVNECYTYDLVSVVNHIGRVGFGHYNTYAKSDEKWYKLNDADVDEIDENAVVTESAYLLFYVRSDIK